MQLHEKPVALEEAIRLFAAKANDSDKHEFCTFVDMLPATYTAWKNAPRIRPVGLGRVRIRHFLEYRGYHIDEIEGLKEPILSLSRILAFGVLTPAQLAVELGVKKERDIFTVLFSIVSPKLFRLNRIASIVQKYQDALKEKLPVLSSRETVPAEPAVIKQAPVVPVRSQIDGPLTKETKRALIASFVALAKPLLPIAEFVLSEAFSAEDRKRVREMMDGDGVFKLSTLFRDLCSETTRNSHRTNQQ